MRSADSTLIKSLSRVFRIAKNALDLLCELYFNSSLLQQYFKRNCPCGPALFRSTGCAPVKPRKKASSEKHTETMRRLLGTSSPASRKKSAQALLTAVSAGDRGRQAGNLITLQRHCALKKKQDFAYQCAQSVCRAAAAVAYKGSYRPPPLHSTTASRHAVRSAGGLRCAPGGGASHALHRPRYYLRLS